MSNELITPSVFVGTNMEHEQVYRPRSPEEVCGNPGVMAALSMWLGEWKEKRRRGGPGDGSGSGRKASGGGDDSGEESEVQQLVSIYIVGGERAIVVHT